MKTNQLLMAGVVLLSGTSMMNLASVVNADERTMNTTADVTFKEDTGTTDPVDPTDPTNPVDPTDPVTPTEGPLSIDYASSFKFGEQKISAKDETYFAKLVDISDGTKRQNWVQVTDKRGTNAGWSLTVKQEKQLETTDGNATELKGAEIKIMNAQAKTGTDNYSAAPSATPSEMTLTPGAEVDVMAAKKDEGMGTWVDSFGDETTGDKSVSLSIPGTSAKVKDSHYVSELTWTLSDTPA